MKELVILFSASGCNGKGEHEQGLDLGITFHLVRWLTDTLLTDRVGVDY